MFQIIVERLLVWTQMPVFTLAEWSLESEWEKYEKYYGILWYGWFNREGGKKSRKYTQHTDLWAAIWAPEICTILLYDSTNIMICKSHPIYTWNGFLSEKNINIMDYYDYPELLNSNSRKLRQLLDTFISISWNVCLNICRYFGINISVSQISNLLLQIFA